MDDAPPSEHVADKVETPGFLSKFSPTPATHFKGNNLLPHRRKTYCFVSLAIANPNTSSLAVAACSSSS